MHIHLVQYAISSLDTAANRARVRELVRDAGVTLGSMIVLPELFSTGTLPQGFDAAVAATIARDDRAFLSELARETKSTLVAGVLGLSGVGLVWGGVDAGVHGAPGMLRNLCVVIGPDGAEISAYQKIHPFSLGGEDKLFASGARVAVTPVEGFTVQTAVCYDLRFPELFRAGSLRGVDLIVVPANWPASRREHWDVLLRARAIENQCYVAGVNCVGAQHGTSYEGGTALVSPKGEVLAVAADEGRAEGVIGVEISADHVRAWRRVFPALRDRKDENFWDNIKSEI